MPYLNHVEETHSHKVSFHPGGAFKRDNDWGVLREASQRGSMKVIPVDVGDVYGIRLKILYKLQLYRWVIPP